MIFVLFSAIIAFAVAVLALQNSMVVTVNFIAWSFEASQVLVILGSALLGFLVAFCWGLYGKAKNYLQNRKVKEQIKTLESEKQALLARVQQLEAASSPLPGSAGGLTTPAASATAEAATETPVNA